MKHLGRVRAASRAPRNETLALGLGALLGLACRSAHPASPELPGAPVPAPALGIAGCVESDELHAYVSALDAARRSAREAALAARGARLEARRGVFLGATGVAPLDAVLEQGEKRYAVVAQRAAGFDPVVELAESGSSLHRIDERPRSHGVPVLACGITPCRPARSLEQRARPEVRAVGVELAPGEALGPALSLTYDYWWAAVSYPKHARCDAPPQVSAR